MFVETKPTPNPNTYKFFPGVVIMQSGTVDFNNVEETANSYLARSLFEIEGVEGVFFGYDFISVSKNEDKDWHILKPEILIIMMNHFVAKKPIFVDEDAIVEDEDTDEETDEYSDSDQELVDQIKDLIETRVRPAVAQDGGDIVFRGYSQGVVKLKLKGACSGCPSAMVTLKDGIENMLQYYVPQVTSVEAVE